MKVMPRSYRYLHYDVFTDHLFGGNQLAVVLDGRGLAARTMQAGAEGMNFCETTFVLPPERADTDVRMRIFTPGDELPMAGHPTIGSTFARARRGVPARSRRPGPRPSARTPTSACASSRRAPSCRWRGIRRSGVRSLWRAAA